MFSCHGFGRDFCHSPKEGFRHFEVDILSATVFEHVFIFLAERFLRPPFIILFVSDITAVDCDYLSLFLAKLSRTSLICEVDCSSDIAVSGVLRIAFTCKNCSQVLPHTGFVAKLFYAVREGTGFLSIGFFQRMGSRSHLKSHLGCSGDKIEMDGEVFLFLGVVVMKGTPESGAIPSIGSAGQNWV